MQLKKTREEIIQQVYLTQSDIATLISCSRPKAKKIYDLAEEIDIEKLNKFRIEETKVRITSVCRVLGITLNTLQKIVCKEQ